MAVAVEETYVPPQTLPADSPALREFAFGSTVFALGCLSAWLYWQWLVRPFLLTRYVNEPLLDLGKIGGYDPEAGRRFTLPLVAIWLAYLAAWWLATRLRGAWVARGLAFGGGLGLSALLLWLYPITAADIFNYIIYGLIQHAGHNPLVVQPFDVIGRPLITFSAWPFHPSPYGPFWQQIAWAVTAVTGERLLAGVLGFKLVLIAFHLLNTVLIEQIAAGLGQERPWVAALAYAWNPLLLYETAGNGHNDIVMLTGLLLALWLLNRRSADMLALPALALAALAKYVAALWAPVVLLAGLPAQGRARRWRAVLVGGSLALALVAVSFGPFWDDGKALDGVRRQSDLYTTSLGSWLIMLLTERQLVIGRGLLLDLIKQTSAALLLLTILLTWPRRGERRELVNALFAVSLAYLLIGALWFQPWYLVPLMGLLPLVNAGRRAIAIVYALGATGSYVFYFYGWPQLDWTEDRFVVQSWAVATAHGPTWLALLVAALWWAWRWANRLRQPEIPAEIDATA